MAEPGVKRRSERRVHALNHFTSRALVHLRGGAGLSVVTRARSAFSVTEVTVSSLLGWWRSGPPWNVGSLRARGMWWAHSEFAESRHLVGRSLVLAPGRAVSCEQSQLSTLLLSPQAGCTTSITSPTPASGSGPVATAAAVAKMDRGSLPGCAAHTCWSSTASRGGRRLGGKRR